MFNKHFACSIAFDKQIYNWSRMKQMEAVVGEKNEINKQFFPDFHFWRLCLWDGYDTKLPYFVRSALILLSYLGTLFIMITFCKLT